MDIKQAVLELSARESYHDFMTISPESKNLLKDLTRKYRLKIVVLFGSAAQGKLRPESDIDAAVLAADYQPLSASAFLEISSELAKILDIGFRRLDLVDLVKANILLRYEIMTKATLLSGDETDFINYRIFAFNDYIDGQSLRNLETLLINRRQALLAQKIHA